MSETTDLPGFDYSVPSTWHPMHRYVTSALHGVTGMLGVRLGTNLAPAAEHIARALWPGVRSDQTNRVVTPSCDHDWLWHQPPDASRSPLVGICRTCGSINHDHIAIWAEDRCKTAVVLAEAEVSTLRRLLADVLPYVAAGADALDHWEPYGGAKGSEYDRIQAGAAAMLARLPEIRRETGR